MYSRTEDDIFFFQLSFTSKQPPGISYPDIANIMPPNKSPNSDEIVGSTIYLTFNRPQVDDCHRAILCTNPSIPNNPISGTLFHVEYDTASSSSKPKFVEHVRSGKWSFRERPSRDPAGAESLLYVQKIGEIDPCRHGEVLDAIRDALRDVPVGRENRERVLGRLGVGEGNVVLDGYDCVVWTVDALRELNERGLVRLGRDPTVFMGEARKAAWPGDIADLISQSCSR
ncbi:hypothetical protein BKA65DRAFT_31641 [Rhexocercosporidium sp. MPI-PUGE-AT-0058]|nr:hypothetical protein BKA65DRAFT_31641 [Rhexocercosporidium sp. MPI-PUGE-AT-0058]